MALPPLVPLEEMVARLERALSGSPADSTELTWIEARRSQEGNGNRRRESFELRERSIVVRVRESGRTGVHRTSHCALAELEQAVREALAQARLAARTPAAQPPAAEPLPEIPGLYDPEVPRLTPARARELVQKTAERGETVRLGWAEGRLAVVNSRSLRRATEVTSAWLEVSRGRAPGAGYAAAVSRSLAAANSAEVWERARRRDAPPGALAELPAKPVAMALAPEAAAVLIDLLNRHALSSISFLDGSSFLSGRIGEELFNTALSLRDDPLQPHGAPFPCDLFGAAKTPMDFVRAGLFVGPVRDERLAQTLGQPPTAHMVAPDEALASHPALPPGDQPEGEALRQADGGIWVGRLGPVEMFDRKALRFRATARGVRRIHGGLPGPALPDLLWEGSLADLLAGPLILGQDTVAVAAGGDPLFGAVSAPLLVLAMTGGSGGSGGTGGAGSLRPDPTPRS
jgi:predicted Zn-dependent protease